MRLASLLLLVPAVLPIACFLSIPDVPGETGGAGTTTSTGGTGTGTGTGGMDTGGTSVGGTGGEATGGAGGVDECAGKTAYSELVKCHAPEAYYPLDEIVVIDPMAVEKEYTTPEAMMGANTKYRADLKGGDVLSGLAAPVIGNGKSIHFAVQRQLFLTYIAAPGNAAWNFHDLKTFTIEVWIRPTQETMESVLLYKEKDSAKPGYEPGYELGIEHGPSGDPNAWVPYMRRGRTKLRLDSGKMVADSAYHIVATYDGSETKKQLCLYVNALGKCVASADLLPLQLQTPAIFCNYAFTPNADMDELALYYKALTPEQVQDHYLAGTGQL